MEMANDVLGGAGVTSPGVSENLTQGHGLNPRAAGRVCDGRVPNDPPGIRLIKKVKGCPTSRYSRLNIFRHTTFVSRRAKYKLYKDYCY